MTTTPSPTRALAPDIDPVRFEVIRNALLAITEEMGATLRRAAYSTNIKTRGDFSCAFFDRDLRTIAQAFAQPSHLGSLAHIVPRAIATYGVERLAPGDGILINDPYLGGVHLNDITLITPVFHEGTLFGYVANIAHHVDVGGGAPGSIGVSSEIYQEGSAPTSAARARSRATSAPRPRPTAWARSGSRPWPPSTAPAP